MTDLIEEAYGPEVADAMRGAAPHCECCGGIEHLRGVSLLLADYAEGGRGLTDTPVRFICSACHAIWYDGPGITDSELIGAEHRRRKAAGEYPFCKREAE